MFRYNIVDSFLFRVTNRLASQKGGPVLFQSTESVANVIILPVIKCVEKWLTRTFHWLRQTPATGPPPALEVRKWADSRPPPLTGIEA